MKKSELEARLAKVEHQLKFVMDILSEAVEEVRNHPPLVDIQNGKRIIQ